MNGGEAPKLLPKGGRLIGGPPKEGPKEFPVKPSKEVGWPPPVKYQNKYSLPKVCEHWINCKLNSFVIQVNCIH